MPFGATDDPEAEPPMSKIIFGLVINTVRLRAKPAFASLASEAENPKTIFAVIRAAVDQTLRLWRLTVEREGQAIIDGRLVSEPELFALSAPHINALLIAAGLYLNPESHVLSDDGETIVSWTLASL